MIESSEGEVTLRRLIGSERTLSSSALPAKEAEKTPGNNTNDYWARDFGVMMQH